MINTISYSDFLDFIGLDRPTGISDADFSSSEVTFDEDSAWLSVGGVRVDLVAAEAEAFASRVEEYEGNAVAAFNHWRSLTTALVSTEAREAIAALLDPAILAEDLDEAVRSTLADCAGRNLAGVESYVREHYDPRRDYSDEEITRAAKAIHSQS